MNSQLDEIDKRILHALVADARNTSAPMIAEEVEVSPATIRNRITELEDAGIITGYHATVDYEQCEGRLMNLFTCQTPVSERSERAQQVFQIPGVIHVRELRTGKGNLQVKAVARDTSDLTRIANQLDKLGLDIQDESLIEDEHVSPYQPFGANSDVEMESLADFTSLAGDAEVAEVTVPSDAPITNTTLKDANDHGLLPDEVLIIAIEREGEILTPNGDTEILAEDVVSIFSRGGISSNVYEIFESPTNSPK